MMEATLSGSAEMSFTPLIVTEQPQSNVAQIIAVLSGRDGDVRTHFHRDGGRWKLRGTEYGASDGELCSIVEWFAAAKGKRWND